MPRADRYTPQKKIHWPSEDKLDRARWRRFFAELASTGAIVRSCKRCKIGKRKINRLREDYEDFEQKMQESLSKYVEDMESEADRRGMQGVDKAVYFQGEIVGYEKKYSDDLLKFRLRGLRPERYRDNHPGSGQNLVAPIINIYLPDNKRADKSRIIDAPFEEVISLPQPETDD